VARTENSGRTRRISRRFGGISTNSMFSGGSDPKENLIATNTEEEEEEDEEEYGFGCEIGKV